MAYHEGRNRQVNEFPFSGKVLFIGQPESHPTKMGNTITFRILVLQAFIGTYSYPVSFEFNMSTMGQLADVKDGEWVDLNFALSGFSTTKDGITRYYNKNIGLSILKK